METFTNILWSVLAGGGLGAFIDFLIGRTGQEKVKNLLLEWWVRVDDSMTFSGKILGKRKGCLPGIALKGGFAKAYGVLEE